MNKNLILGICAIVMVNSFAAKSKCGITRTSQQEPRAQVTFSGLSLAPIKVNNCEYLSPGQIQGLIRVRYGPCSEDAEKPWWVGLPWSLNRGTDAVYARFESVHQQPLQWPDRRPIGSLIIATSARGWQSNPRGWFLDPSLDVRTSKGVAAFRNRLLRWADTSVAVLKEANAQGMITWDIEGEQYPQPVTYIGDPAKTETLAPEMSGVVDEYFKRFRAAGLRVGVTLRPQILTLPAQDGQPRQEASGDPAETLKAKIAYAKKRWGATLFYIDSNGNAIWPLDDEVIRRVQSAYPDVLLIPEHKNTAYFAVSAPYCALRSGCDSTPERVRGIYEHAFSVINVADGDIRAHTAELRAAVSRGDVLMFRGWYADPLNALVKAIYSGRI